MLLHSIQGGCPASLCSQLCAVASVELARGMYHNSPDDVFENLDYGKSQRTSWCFPRLQPAEQLESFPLNYPLHVVVIARPVEAEATDVRVSRCWQGKDATL
jgi:hypothetical protein